MMLTFDALLAKQEKIAVVGLGYVGLPLAVHLSRHFDVVGYDFKASRIAELASGKDRTLEVSDEAMAAATVTYTDDPKSLGECRLIIVAVPTPIDQYRIPDLTPLCSASESTGRHLTKGSCVVFESTVYPGATEEVCVPILEKRIGPGLRQGFQRGLLTGTDQPRGQGSYGRQDHEDRFRVRRTHCPTAGKGLRPRGQGRHPRGAYPQGGRGGQGDREHSAGPEHCPDERVVDDFRHHGHRYHGGAGSGRHQMELFAFQSPALVGGHCIGVDPYYLTFKAESIGYHPEMILAGRRINDGMGKYVAERVVKLMIQEGKQINHTRVGVLGITFKEDVPDLRNTRVVDIIENWPITASMFWSTIHWRT
jgi:UDP-N-acetyl-D-galactosamine dehydrogenase